jgi:hypothetical protein
MDAAVRSAEKGRLIVLVPESLVPDMEMMNQIYQMATRERCEVFYLALVDGNSKMLAATRSIATLKALVSGGKLSSASRVVDASHWLETLREIYRSGDMIVCQAEQQVRSGLFRTRPASEVVRAELHAPVSTISGFYHPEDLQVGRWLNRLIYWAGLLAIVGLFFLLEIRLDQGIHGTARSVLLAALLLATLAAGIAWNKIGN